MRWLNERLRLGFAEWNAPGYYVEDIMPLLNLADFAVDKDIRTRAAMVMDLLVFDLAVHTQGGAICGLGGPRLLRAEELPLGTADPGFASRSCSGTNGHFVESSNAAAFLATSPGLPPTRRADRHRRRPDPSASPPAAASRSTSTRLTCMAWARALRKTWSSGGAAPPSRPNRPSSRHAAWRPKPGCWTRRRSARFCRSIEKVANIIDTAEDVGGGILGGIGGAIVGFAAAGPVGAIVGGTAGAIAGASVPDFTQVDAADQFSVLTEGSVLTRANIYSHRSGAATLASVQNFRRGQINLQGWPCVASLSKGAMVWTSYPSAGSTISLSLAFGLIELDEDIFPTSHDGPNWWTGNVVQPRVVQVRGAAITAYRAKAIQETLFGERTHAWFPKNQFDETRGPESARCNHDSARWFFGRRGDGYVALVLRARDDVDRQRTLAGQPKSASKATRTSSSPRSAAPRSSGPSRSSWPRWDRRGCGSHGLHSGAELQCSYDVPFGERLELHYDQGARYGGEPLQDDEFPRHRSPFARIEWQQDRYAIRYDNRSLVHDVVNGTRTVGGRSTELVHDTPLTFYAQNMALLPWPLYKGIDSDAALGRLIGVLRERQPDVVGLSEMWSSSDRAARDVGARATSTLTRSRDRTRQPSISASPTSR